MAKIPIIGWIEKKIKRILAIVQDTDTASQAIAKGKYVIWHDELYTASSAIAEGTTLATGAGGNLTSVSDGGLNELNNNLANLLKFDTLNISNTVPPNFNTLTATESTVTWSNYAGKKIISYYLTNMTYANWLLWSSVLYVESTHEFHVQVRNSFSSDLTASATLNIIYVDE